ncbi:hypothetical protein [Streptomyces lydicus]|uniref:hypothetical protein n=1 Tax=Streptomyces lydicus TaxID=47763 RepID=UPI0036E30F48
MSAAASRIRPPKVLARAGNANVRAFLAQGVHPASRQPLANVPGTRCATCVLAYRIQLPAPDDAGTEREHSKCSHAPTSRRGRHGIDLGPEIPACTLHCTYTNWPLDPYSHDQTINDAIGFGQDHPDDAGVYAVYRIFGVDLELQRVWVELIGESTPAGYIACSLPEKPHLYRFWADLSRLHSARIHHPVDARACTHQLVRNGRVLLGVLGS